MVHHAEGVSLLDNDKQMRDYSQKEVYCNCCGNPITRTAIIDTHMDYVHIEKEWGYFSCKDLTRHSFNVCEKCYDKWTDSFAIPVEEFLVEDITLYSEEEISMLNKAYRKAGLCK